MIPAAILEDDVLETLLRLATLLEYPALPVPFGFKESAALDELTPEEREEAYTATFDVTPASIPYVSIHLFGEENFKRGEFMAALSGRCAELGFDTHGELPDHIANMLRLAATVDATERRELFAHCILGPVEKMLVGLRDGNPYHPILRAVRETVQAAYPGLQAVAAPMMGPETTSCGGCSTMNSHTLEAAAEPMQS